MKRILIAGLIVLAVIAIGLLLVAATPSTSSVQISCLTGDTGCTQLPNITGANLNGDAQTFPDGFAHSYQLVVMPFDREQQMRVLDFLPLFEELSTLRPDIGYYSLAALPDLAAPIRLLINAGMTTVITDPDVREATYIFYLEDQIEFLDALNLPDTEAIQVYIFDDAGNVLWNASGDFTPALADEIREAISKLPLG